MQMRSIFLFVLLFFTNLYYTEAQQLNIQVESQTASNPTVSTSGIAGSYTAIESSPVTPSIKKTEASIIEELYENAQTKALSISTDFPSYSELAKVAANNRSNFLHVETNTTFPHLIEDFERIQLITPLNKPGKVDVIYKSRKNKSTFTISLEPGGEAVEGRLRNIYLTGIKQLSKEQGKNYLPKPTFLKFRGSRYISNGVQGLYVNDTKSFSQFNAFECGSWIFGVKLFVEGMDELGFTQFKEELIRYINPARLTALRPMNLKPNVDFTGEALKDTVVTGALFGSAFKKINWAERNVSEKERYSGFPDIYLGMHVEALKEYLKIIGRKPNRSKVPENARFYSDLKSINDAGFLAEFIVESYENVMIIPSTVNIDTNSYNHWKTERQLDVDLLKKRYKINYRALPY